MEIGIITIVNEQKKKILILVAGYFKVNNNPKKKFPEGLK